MKILTPLYLVIAVAVAFGGEPSKTIKRVPVTDANSLDGQVLFTHYCAVCHGKDANGTGPAADALKKAPADLTQIARKNGGVFPEIHVLRVIKGDDRVSAHGSPEMPVWGELFSLMRNKETAALRVNALMKYLEKIQAK